MNGLGLVGPGTLGRTIALSLPMELYPLGPVLSRSRVSGRRAVREMKRGHAVTSWTEFANVNTIIVTVPQEQLAGTLACALSGLTGLRTKRILLTSLASGDARAGVDRLQSAGAQVGGLLPIAIYRRPSIVSPGTTFAVWGDVRASRAARALVKAIGGKHVMIDIEEGAHVLLGAALVSGMLTTSLELGVRRLVRAGFPRTRAIEALSPIADACFQEHRKSRQAPPAPHLPLAASQLLRASEAAGPLEASLCSAGLRLAGEDLR